MDIHGNLGGDSQEVRITREKRGQGVLGEEARRLWTVSHGILILKISQVQASPGSLLYCSHSIIFASCIFFEN